MKKNYKINSFERKENKLKKRTNFVSMAVIAFLGIGIVSPIVFFPTTGGGTVLAGDSWSVGSYPGMSNDILVYKLDGSGKKQWRKNYGGAMFEGFTPMLPIGATRMIPTADGGYLLACNTDSFTHGYPGADIDILVYKLDSSGGVLWWRFLGGMYMDGLSRILEVTN